MSKLYEVKMYCDYKEELERFIFNDREKARTFMRVKWQEVISTDWYDEEDEPFFERSPEHIVKLETYYEDDYARVVWKNKETQSEQWLQFNIEEVYNMLDTDYQRPVRTKIFVSQDTGIKKTFQELKEEYEKHKGRPVSDEEVDEFLFENHINNGGDLFEEE